MAQMREANPNWKGGRSIASNGYVLVKVGVDHHLADCRGYAYEHRLKAEKKLGRRLRRKEEVHHKDECKTNNKPRNLIVCRGRRAHYLHHRLREKGLRRPGERNRIVKCRCRCGATFRRFDKHGRRRVYLPGHNNNGRGR